MELHLNWWQWLALFWAALGTIGVMSAKLALRISGSTDPLSLNDDPLATIGAGLLLILAGPLLPLFMIGVCAQTISQGRLPLSNGAWWPTRASKFLIAEPRPALNETVSLEDHSPETLLCRMIELRRPLDLKLRHREAPRNWPMFLLWKTTEATVLDIVEAYCWLCDGGLTAQKALQRINAAHFGISFLTFELTATLQSFIAERLSIEDPDYIALGTNLLREAVGIAEAWSKAKIDRSKTDRPYPPLEWLKTRVSASEIEAGASLPFRDSQLIMVTDGRTETVGTTVPIDPKWRRIKLRMVAGDELWTFSSPPECWRNLGGRMGVALLRNGKAIGHITTAMN